MALVEAAGYCNGLLANRLYHKPLMSTHGPCTQVANMWYDAG